MPACLERDSDAVALRCASPTALTPPVFDSRVERRVTVVSHAGNAIWLARELLRHGILEEDDWHPGDCLLTAAQGGLTRWLNGLGEPQHLHLYMFYTDMIDSIDLSPDAWWRRYAPEDVNADEAQDQVGAVGISWTEMVGFQLDPTTNYLNACLPGAGYLFADTLEILLNMVCGCFGPQGAYEYAYGTGYFDLDEPEPDPETGVPEETFYLTVPKALNPYEHSEQTWRELLRKPLPRGLPPDARAILKHTIDCHKRYISGTLFHMPHSGDQEAEIEPGVILRCSMEDHIQRLADFSIQYATESGMTVLDGTWLLGFIPGRRDTFATVVEELVKMRRLIADTDRLVGMMRDAEIPITPW